MDRCAAETQRYLCRAVCVITLGLSPSQRKPAMFSVHVAFSLTVTQFLSQFLLHHIVSILVLFPLCWSTFLIVSWETIAWYTRRIQRKPVSACKHTMSKVKPCLSKTLTSAYSHSVNQSVLHHQINFVLECFNADWQCLACQCTSDRICCVSAHLVGTFVKQ